MTPPNWSKLEALGRAAIVLFAATFFGALVFTGGQLPADWASWKPILGTALGASVAAEIIWIRSQLAAAASALGLPGAPPDPASDAPKVAQRGFVHVAALLAALVGVPLTIAGGGGARSVAGCTSQQVQTAEQVLGPGIIFGECVWTTYESVPAGTPALTYIATEITACGGDSATVLEVLDQRETPTLHRPTAHATLAR